MKKFKFPGELALFFAIVINSFGVVLMTKSGFGISSISSVPYVFSMAFSFLSFGTWNYLFQTMLVAILMILYKRINFGYIFSFAMGIVFGKMLDFFQFQTAGLPEGLGVSIFYIILSFFILAFGICLANNSLLPIIPTDVFPRDLSSIIAKPYKNVKTIFDLSCLTATAVISFFILHRITGVGLGTVICALSTGKAVSLVQGFLDKHITFYRAVALNRRNLYE